MLNGVLVPVTVRPIEDGEYEMISGHRRLFAVKEIGLERIPAIVKNYDDDEAVLAMVDSRVTVIRIRSLIGIDAMNEEDKIKQLYIRCWDCMISRDIDGLRSLQADDYYLLHMTGVKQDREVFIKGLLDGTFNYYSAEHDSVEVNVSGDTATMIGRSRVVAAVYGGGKGSWRLQGDFTLRKESGNWRFTSSKASTY